MVVMLSVCAEGFDVTRNSDSYPQPTCRDDESDEAFTSCASLSGRMLSIVLYDVEKRFVCGMVLLCFAALPPRRVWPPRRAWSPRRALLPRRACGCSSSWCLFRALCCLARFHSTIFYCAPPCAPPWLRSGCRFSMPFIATMRRMLL